jgi:hypothetical protein
MGLNDGVRVVGFGDAFGVGSCDNSKLNDGFEVGGLGGGTKGFGFSVGYGVGKGDGLVVGFNVVGSAVFTDLEDLFSSFLLDLLSSLGFDAFVSLGLGTFALVETAVLNIFFLRT